MTDWALKLGQDSHIHQGAHQAVIMYRAIVLILFYSLAMTSLACAISNGGHHVAQLSALQALGCAMYLICGMKQSAPWWHSHFMAWGLNGIGSIIAIAFGEIRLVSTISFLAFGIVSSAAIYGSRKRRELTIQSLQQSRSPVSDPPEANQP